MLDKIDIKIIHRLGKNGRISLTDLSAGMDLSRVAIANRIEKLVQSSIIRVGPLVNTQKLQYQTLIVELQVEKKEQFKQLIARCPRILHAFETMGPFSHLVVCVSKNNQSLKNFVENVLKQHASSCKVTLADSMQNFVPLKTAEGCKGCKLCGESEDGI